jgi:hypothetical protein
MQSDPKLYLEHSAVSQESWWPQIDAILALGRVRLAVSLWNLVEIGGATDRAQQDRRLAFLDRQNPVWIVERVDVQHQEVQRFLWRHHFKVTAADISVFVPHLSIVDAIRSRSRPRVGITPRAWIDGIDFKNIEEKKKPSPDALNRLQAIDAKTFKRRHGEIFKPWIRPLIPAVDPSGKLLSAAARTELLDHCAANQEAFMAECPSLAVEDALTAARTADRKRKPKTSDGIDMMHTVVALSYCDHFLVRDKFARTCCARVKQALGARTLAQVHADPTSLVHSIKSSAAAPASNDV